MTFLLSKDYRRIKTDLVRCLTDMPEDEREGFIDEAAVTAMSKHDDQSKPSTWIYNYTLLQYKSWKRKQKRRRIKCRVIYRSRLPEVPDNPDRAVDNVDEVEFLLSKLDKMTASIIADHYFGNQTHNDLSKKYRTSISTIKRLISEGLERMRQ